MDEGKNTIPQYSLPARELNELAEIYQEADARWLAYKANSIYACPPCCGYCCTKFEPDVLPIEAEYAAAFLYNGVSDGSGLLLRTPETAGCPLYNPGNPLHCPIYRARPLVCRLFAFSATADKKGKHVYIPCGKMVAGKATHRALTGHDREAIRPPLMSDFGTAVVALRPGQAGSRMALGRALLKAWEKICLAARLGGDTE